MAFRLARRRDRVGGSSLPGSLAAIVLPFLLRLLS
jgi:hypothetical protein